MEGYERDSYGEAFADVYDEWYGGGRSGTAEAAELLALLADIVAPPPERQPARLLELGVGTGRLAIPAAAAGWRVTGLDASAAMLARLAQADGAGAIDVIHGDMVNDLPPGPFDAVLVAFNVLFNLQSAARQQELFAAVAAILHQEGRLLVEAFVPDDPPRAGSALSVRSISADRVVLSAVLNDPAEQCAHGQFIELSEAGGVRLRPWSIRYATPAQLDDMASAAGLALDARYADAAGAPFDSGSSQHVSVYRPLR